MNQAAPDRGGLPLVPIPAQLPQMPEDPGMKTLGVLRGLPSWRRGAAWRIGFLDRYEGNGLVWLLAGLLLAPVPGLLTLLPPAFDGPLFWILWPLLVCFLGLQVGRLGRSVLAGLVAGLAAVVLVLIGPAEVQYGGLTLLGRERVAVVVEHEHAEGIFWSVAPWGAVRGLPWSTERYRLRTVDGDPIRPDMVTAEPVEPVLTVLTDPVGLLPPAPAADVAAALPEINRFWLWAAGPYALAVGWASVRRARLGSGGRTWADRRWIDEDQRAERRRRRIAERARRRNRART